MKRIHLFVPRKRDQLYIGTVKSVISKHWYEDEDSIDVSSKAVHVLRLPVSMKDTDRLSLKKAVEHHFHQRCSCEYDCCGCWFGGVRTFHFNSKRDVVVTTSYSRNY